MLKMQMIKHEDMSEHVKLFLEKLFEARYAVLGKPQNPAAVVAALVDEDSQDYWAGNDLPPEAFLDPDDPLKEKEAIMHKVCSVYNNAGDFVVENDDRTSMNPIFVTQFRRISDAVLNHRHRMSTERHMNRNMIYGSGSRCRVTRWTSIRIGYVSRA